MKMNDMFPSNFLKKDDVPQPVTATIREVVVEEINGDHGKETKPVIRFNGTLKPLILNKGNAELLSSLYGDDSTLWHGKPIEVYMDPHVMYAGKRVGGIRLRAPQQQQQQHTQYAPAPTGGWQISDGKNVVKKNSADEVRAYFLELLDMHVAPETRRVRCPDGSVLDGAAWMMNNGGVQQEDPIPF